uniref:Ig-like domain-containing protein n=1 Tax=Caenorhabditis japonica TaxID=281687 RepID=A0A8R1HM90_CAEJA
MSRYVFGVNYGPKPTVPITPNNSSSSLSGMSHILNASAKPKKSTSSNGMGLLNLSASAKDAILGAVQHPRSYARIQEIEAPKPAPHEVPDLPHQPPAFVKQLGPAIQCMEGDNVYLEAQVTPTDDNSLTYEWLVNGQPLMKAHRFVLSQDFGYIALNILYCYPEDNGTYTLVVRNRAGEAQSSVDINCGHVGGNFTDSFHPNSLHRIAELEAPIQRAEPAADKEKEVPKIVKALPPKIDSVHESQTLHLEAQVTPIDDNTLRYEWLFNGQPLKASSRYRVLNDFGFVSLDIDYIIAEDSGKYTLVVHNAAGHAETSCEFQVDRLKSILSDTAHPESLRRIREMEQLQPAKPSDDDGPAQPPVFTQPLAGPTEPLKEGQSVHMDCVVQPINDPSLRIEWFHDGQPLMFGSRIRTIHDFGYVGLEFLHIHPEDTGTYTCRATNLFGEASTDIFLECKPRRNIYLDTHHESSWQKIQEIENRVDEREPTPELTFQPPTFTEVLADQTETQEGQAIRLECRLIPVNDPTMRVTWTRNGQPLPEASRFMPARNFDYVNLDILALYGEDSGIYTCKAVSAFGEAATSCTVKCAATKSLLLDTMHDASWKRVQEIENREKLEPVDAEPEKIAPKFVVPLNSSLGELQEGVPIHLECQVEPTNDNQLTVQWYHNGQPLANGHRFRTRHDFGYVALDILYAFAQDTGEWACVARNSLGEAQTVANFTVLPRGTIYTDTQHPESWQKIQVLEAPREAALEQPDVEHDAPQFIEPIESLERIEFQPAHFQTKVTPQSDPNLRIQWFKDGQPLGNSNRFKLTTDFGYISLDIAHTIPEDSGVYSVKASNAKGEAQVEGQLTVRGNASIIGDTQHEQSWQKIQLIEAPRAPGEEAPDVKHGPPKFVTQLHSLDGVVEGQPSHFEAQFIPFSDPKTIVQWYLNGNPLSASSRRILRNDFGLVSLDLQYTLGEDAGEYSVVVKNTEGEDRTSGQLSCTTRAAILGDTQHAQSWQRIQEIEAPKAPAADAEGPVYEKPSFIQPLQSVGDLPEGSVALLEARLIPVNDPNLRVQWFFNDQPLMESNWISTSNDFGCVSLRIAPVYARHTGVYSCKAWNDNGNAVTSANVGVQGSEGLILGTAHPVSLQKIQELEAIDKYAKLEAPEREYEKPQWVQGFENFENVGEGQTVTLHGLVEPSGDPNLRIEWLLNGTPLMNANRFRQEYEFGNAILTIVHVLPHDSGVYTCRAYNPQGEASTSATVTTAGYEKILYDSQHPVSWQRIQELEAPKIVEEVEEVIQKEKPQFLSQLESAENVQEGVPLHLEATFQPARDSELKAVWQKNGQPLGASQLVQTKHELGWATLDISSVNEDHNGVYTLTISNSEGEAVSTASIRVAGTGPILGDTRHEESWKRIQILEAPKEAEPEAPAPVYDHPAITTQIDDKECNEGDHVHFEANIVPVNDPRLQVQWIRNGVPLAHGSKYAIQQDFGICTLDIAYTYPEDEGVYQLRIWNPDGEAVSSATLKCHGKDAILGDVQHQESWKRIQEIEAPKPKLEEADPEPKGPPRFIQQLSSPGELVETQPAHFEATVEPVDDPTLTISWFLNGQPYSASSRVKMINDFGWVIMDIAQTEPRDSGEWKCVAKNAAGEAVSTATLGVQGKEVILHDSLQPQSLDRIRQIEAGKPAPEERPDQQFEAPVIVSPLQVQGALEEGGSAHLQTQFTPVADPSIKVEWLKDGQPIFHSNRYKMVHDFGFAVLDILHLLKHDAGEYTFRVSNSSGDASTSTNFQVSESSGLILQPQNEQKAKAVEILEDNLRRRPEEIEQEIQEATPVFIEPLSAPVDTEEGGRAHFTARYEPVNDNKLQVQWYHDGRPLKTGSRIKTINSFGYVVLEISPTYPEDNGEYTCRAINKVGEAVTSTKLTCSPKEGIISSTQLPDRMANAGRRIAEIEAPRPAREEALDVDHGPPKFTSALTGPPELQEGQQAHLECQVTPVADPHLKIEWLHNGQPVKHTNRMKVIHDFGFVVLQLSPAEPQDSGTWTCRATNQHGSDEVSTDIKVVGGGGVSYEWQSPAQRKERITELEDWIHRPKEDLNLPPVDYPAPSFSQELTDLGQLNEADATAFVCVLEPIGDPTLRVQWEHNGHPIPYSNRISCSNEFGVATLLIKHLIAADAGEYKCIATNAKGSATTTGTVAVESATQIDAPQVVQPLVDSVENILEGDSIHLECRVTPINDPGLRVQWLRDGQPLPEASRFKPTFEFGFVSLDILYAYPEDNGVYELVAYNDKGEARSKTTLTVLPRPSLDYTSQTHGNQQDSLESHFKQHSQSKLMLTAQDIYNESDKRAPEFRTKLQNIGVLEGEFCRFETQVAPINDPYLKVEWFKDKKPVLLGHRFRSTLDFGFACLDLLYALPDDTGEYHCVATNRHGQTMISAKLACQGASHIITDSQMPQGLRVSNVKNDNKNVYWSEQGGAAQPKQKQPPQFTIPLRNLQVTENQPARFECAVVGYPRPKVTWYINGNQCLHGHRFKLNFDGLHYLTVSKSRISDAGEVVAIARNTEGETISTATLDIFQNDDFRQAKLRPANFKTSEELRERELQWQKDTLGSLGPAFDAAPKPDAQKLMHVERAQSPIEPLESQELIQKFTRPRDDDFYNKLSYVETQKPQFKGLELEPVSLKAGKVDKYLPPVEEMERVNLKAVPEKDQKDIGWERPDWAGQDGTAKLPGADEGRFKKLPTPPPELEIPARDQVKLKTAKPTRGKDVEAGERVKLQTEKAKIKEIQQKPEVPKEEPVVHKDTVQLKQQQLPKTGLKGDHFTVDREKDLKETPAVVKPVIEETRISNKPQPTKIGQSKQAPPTISQQLKPLQGELGKAAKFTIEFAGAAPIKVTWLKDGKEIKSTFRSQIKTSPTDSSLHIGRLDNSHAGEYTVRLENAAGTVESLASLSVAPPSTQGKAPDFKARLNDLRIQQNGPAEFSCQIDGEPKPAIQWFKDGQPLPNDDRFGVVEEGGAYKLKFANILSTDAGVYEIVAKNGAGEARCKARLNVNLQKTGKGAEEGPRYEAPRFSSQIQPIVVDEGKGAQFSAKFNGFPEPTIRWYRNNEPVKHADGYEISQSKGEAVLRISAARNEDVAEYKVEASNPAGKASSVANLVLTPRSGRIAKSTISRGGSAAYQSNDKAAADAPHFLAKLSDISARQGHTVKFSAEVDGNPEPTVQWQFKGKPLSASNNVKISRDGKRAILELARVTPDNAGEYQIIIRNDKGAATSQAKLTLSR